MAEKIKQKKMLDAFLDEAILDAEKLLEDLKVVKQTAKGGCGDKKKGSNGVELKDTGE